MATLDDKILDGPSVGYCSSSDEEERDEVVMEKSKNGGDAGNELKPTISADGGATPRTGPKGVLADYERHRQKQRVQTDANVERLLDVANRFSLTHKPSDAKDEAEKEEEAELERIRERRFAQMKSMARGRIMEVPSRFEFLSLIENESRDGTLLFIHIYSDGLEQSMQLNEALLEIAGILCEERRQMSRARFYKVQTKVLGTSQKFERDGLPALQVYRDEQLIGNFIRLSAELGDDYDGADLYKFLKRNGIPLELRDDASE